MKAFWEWLKSLFAPKKPADVIPIRDIPIETVIPIKVAQTNQSLADIYHNCAIRPERAHEVESIAVRIKNHYKEYHAVEVATGVPWWLVGCIHNKEASMDFLACLHNGERIIGTGRKTTLVPKGKGPFATWEEAAIDALGNQKSKPWNDLGFLLDWAERYNGTGYRSHHINTPYLFAATTAYTKGGYPSDHVYSTEHVVKNPGVAAVMKQMGLFQNELSLA